MEAERLFIVQNIKAVDTAIISIDEDRTVCKSIRFFMKSIKRPMILVLPMAAIKITTQFPKYLCVRNWEFN